MATVLLATFLMVEISTSCTYYAQRHPEPPFKEIARYPLGICTGTHYAANTIQQESVMYLCGADNSHIIKYTYADSSKCEGEYTASIATRNPNDFTCNAAETCPYIVIKVHNNDYGEHDWRKWYSSTWVTNICQNGQLYSCNDNTQYALNIFQNASCDDLPTQVTTYSAAGYVDETVSLSYDIFCNEPDPMSTVLNLPENTMFIHSDVAWNGDSLLTDTIETAVCLNGRIEGQHKDIADESVSYCFAGYDDVFSKPIYSGEVAQIRWTETAGNEYGGAFGLFLYEAADSVGLKYPIAYCFSGESMDISVCDKRWYVDHGTSARYYIDGNMEMAECECTVDLTVDRVSFMTGDTITNTTASPTNSGIESGVMWYTVNVAVYVCGVIVCVFNIGL